MYLFLVLSFLVSLHLLVMKHVTKDIWFDYIATTICNIFNQTLKEYVCLRVIPLP
jgi:hypothetical protein